MYTRCTRTVSEAEFRNLCKCSYTYHSYILKFAEKYMYLAVFFVGKTNLLLQCRWQHGYIVLVREIYPIPTLLRQCGKKNLTLRGDQTKPSQAQHRYKSEQRCCIPVFFFFFFGYWFLFCPYLVFPDLTCITTDNNRQSDPEALRQEIVTMALIGPGVCTSGSERSSDQCRGRPSGNCNFLCHKKLTLCPGRSATGNTELEAKNRGINIHVAVITQKLSTSAAYLHTRCVSRAASTR